jgi:hypothetical protein
MNLTGSKSGNYNLMQAEDNAIISYTYDNMEGYTRNDISPDLFSTNNYEKVQLSAGSYIDAGSPAYKMIYDDDWQIIIYPTKDQLSRLKELETVDITFTKDDITTSADVEVFENNGESYVSLSLSNYMIRYYHERFTDIEIVWASHDGLKIPASAVTTKDFYVVPVEYLIEDDDSTDKAFYILGDDGPELIKPVIYSRDEDFCYLNCTDIAEGTVFVNNETGTQYQIGTTAALLGVYNINKGYAVFRLIEVLYEYGDYCIISEHTDYGVSLYDHIILDGNSVYENQIIY